MANQLSACRVQEFVRQWPAQHPRILGRPALFLWPHRRLNLLRRRLGQASLASRHSRPAQSQKPVVRHVVLATRGENKVLINVGGKGASVAAFDAGTGKVVWQGLDDGASYSSPIAFGPTNDRQAIFFTQAGL